MFWKVSAALLTALALCVPARAATGTVRSFFVPAQAVHPYKTGQTGREVIVYTPSGYDDSAASGRRFPVFYLLHGSPGNPANFVRYGAWPDWLEKANVGPVILVMPDGNYAGEKHGDSEWANSWDGRDKFEEFVVRDVVAWTDKTFRTQADAGHRFVGGVSEGGYGAVNLALRHPDVFGGALSCSGYFHNDGSGWARKIMGYDAAFLRANSPLDYVDDALKAGRIPAGWKTQRYVVGAGGDEKRYYVETRAMAAKLKAAGVPTTLLVLDGKHGWALWNQLFMSGLKTLLPTRS